MLGFLVAFFMGAFFLIELGRWLRKNPLGLPGVPTIALIWMIFVVIGSVWKILFGR